jgi:hypothetical protein
MLIVSANYPGVNDEVIAQVNEWAVPLCWPVFRLVAGGMLIFGGERIH